jgi:hypothetical protein
MAASLGERFARALAAKDFDEVASLLHPEVDFRGMTPGQIWQAGNAVQAIDEILRSWFEDSDRIDELLQVDTSQVADRERRLPAGGVQPGRQVPGRAAGVLRDQRRVDHVDAGAVPGLPARR